VQLIDHHCGAPVLRSWAREAKAMDLHGSEFSRVRAELLSALRRFPAKNRNDVLFGEWSLKAVTAHLAGWDRYFTDILECLEADEEAPYWGNIRRFNEESVNKRKDSSWKAVYEEFAAAGQEFIDRYGQLSQEAMNSRFWPERSYTPAKILQINLHHYGQSHLREITRKLAVLEARRPA
jgi:hypothetical protein